MAGAERIEGTLFGNGERTGNLDLVTMAMNMFSQGIDPQLYFGEMSKIVEISEECTKIPIHIRQPYAGELVFTAFSGSHQDAIKKGMQFVESGSDSAWEVPYLPIDPSDVGGSYRETVRVNSQSGKGGVAFILENYFGVSLPRSVLLEFSPIVQAISEADGENSNPMLSGRLSSTSSLMLRVLTSCWTIRFKLKEMMVRVARRRSRLRIMKLMSVALARVQSMRLSTRWLQR